MKTKTRPYRNDTLVSTTSTLTSGSYKIFP